MIHHATKMMQAHTARVGGGEKDNNFTPKLQVVKSDTPCTSKLQIVESDTIHPAGTKTAVDGARRCLKIISISIRVSPVPIVTD